MWYTVELTVTSGQALTDDDIDAIFAIEGAGAALSQREDTLEGVTMSADGDDMADAARWALERIGEIVAFTPIAVEVMTFEEQDRRLEEPLYPEIVGPDEVAARFDITRDEAVTLGNRDGFPATVADLATGPIWIRSQIEGVLERILEDGGTITDG